MKKSRRIVPAALGLTVLIATMAMTSPAQAQRGGNQRDNNRNARPDMNARRAPAPTTQQRHPQPQATHNNHSRPTPQVQHHHRSRSGPFINVDFGRHVPHTTYDRVWVPGHYDFTVQRVLVEAGHYDTIVHPARYENRCHRDHIDRVLVTPERIEKVWHPAQYENRQVKTWVPGYYKTVADTHYHRTKPSISIGGIFRF